VTDWATLETRMDAAAVRVFGQEAEYRAGCAGDPVALRLILLPAVERFGEGVFVELRPEIHVTKTDLVDPHKGDCFTVGTETWIVDAPPEPQPAHWVLPVRKG
jgi:hypothetical protein